MHFERCTDLALVKDFFQLHPELYEAVRDDFTGPVADFVPIDHPLVSYVLLLGDEGQLYGLAMVNAHSMILWEVHNFILPSVGWKTRTRIARAFLNWLWSCGCKRVIGKVLVTNRYALRFNESMGMERIGTNRRAFLKGGVLQDEVWLGLSSPDSRDEKMG